MTQSRPINCWLRADITLKNMRDLTTQTITVVNRSNRSTTAFYWPILLSVSQLSAEMGLYLPVAQSGSILLDDSLDSFGFERKFSDLLQRYSIVDQPIEIFFGEEVLETEVSTNWTSIWKANAQTWQRSTTNERSSLSIFFDTQVVSKRTLGCPLKAVSPYTILPESTNQNAPIIIGTAVQVKAYPVTIMQSTDYQNAPHFAYVCKMGASPAGFQPTASFEAYCNQGLSRYVKINSASSNIIVSVGATTGARTSGFSSTEEQAFNITPVSYNYICTGFRIRCHGGQTAGTTTGDLTIRLYSCTEVDGAPVTQLAQCVIDKNYYTSLFDGGVDFWLEGTFDKPVIIEADKQYYWSTADQNPNNASRVPYYDDGSTTYVAYYRTNFGWIEALSMGIRFDLMGCALTAAAPANLKGVTAINQFYPYGFQITQPTPGSGQTAIDLSKLDLVVKTDGLVDDTSGNITGSASSLIKKPHHAVKLLSYIPTWSVESYWDHSLYSSTHSVFNSSSELYYREVSGATKPEQSLSEALEAICASTACRIGMSNNGKLGLWAWGTSISSSKIFTPEICRIERIYQADPSWVINRVSFNYSRQLLGASISTAAARGGLAQFYNANDSNIDSVTETNLIGNSTSLFGTRILNQKDFDWLSEDTALTTPKSAQSLVRYFLSVFNSPWVFVELICPLSEGKTLKLLDVVTIFHPELPSYYGSSQKTRPGQIDGWPILLGEQLPAPVRAETYRAQIEGRRIFFDANQGPQLLLKCRLLLNYPDDPT